MGHQPSIRDWSGEATRKHALDTDCGCAKRPQLCPYHQGMEDGMDSVGNLLIDGDITPADLGMDKGGCVTHAGSWVVPT